MKRGQIWWADLAEPRGSEPGLRRPVLIVQDDLLNASALQTVMVVPLTTNLRRAEAVGNVLLREKDSGLRRDSVAMICQVMTVDRDSLTEPAGNLPRRIQERIDAGLKLALDLE